MGWVKYIDSNGEILINMDYIRIARYCDELVADGKGGTRT